MSETRATYQTQPTGERYLIYRETRCPACNGDGWRIVDENDLCPECDGTGRKLEEVAVLDSLLTIEHLLPKKVTLCT